MKVAIERSKADTADVLTVVPPPVGTSDTVTARADWGPKPTAGIPATPITTTDFVEPM